MKKSKFKLFDAILAMVCIVLGTESVCSAAAVGNSQYFWWITLLVLFFIPYGLVSSELGTTYLDESGIFYWVKRAFGAKWASRVSYYYWINFPIWIASCAVAVNGALQLMLNTTFPVFIRIIVELLFTLLVCVLGATRISIHKNIINIGTIIKMFILLGLGGLGIYVALTRGSATVFTIRSLLPTFSFNSLNYISVIVFCFIGFEIVATFREQVEKPHKTFPIIVIISGILIAIFYLFASFGLNVAVPVEELNLDVGLLEAFKILLNVGNDSIIIKIIALGFIITIFVSLLSWAEGTYLQCIEAAKNNGMPKIFKYEKKDLNIGSTFVTFITSFIIILCEPFINSNVFWNFFALNVITLLLTYLPMFLAFKKLRKKDKLRIRLYKVPGNDFVISLITYIPTLIMILSLILTLIPAELSRNGLINNIPLYVGTIVCVILGEIFVRNCKN